MIFSVVGFAPCVLYELYDKVVYILCIKPKTNIIVICGVLLIMQSEES